MFFNDVKHVGVGHVLPSSRFCDCVAASDRTRSRADARAGAGLLAAAGAGAAAGGLRRALRWPRGGLHGLRGAPYGPRGTPRARREEYVRVLCNYKFRVDLLRSTCTLTKLRMRPCWKAYRKRKIHRRRPAEPRELLEARPRLARDDSSGSCGCAPAPGAAQSAGSTGLRRGPVHAVRLATP